MRIDKVHDFMDFIIDKQMQAYYSPPEKDSLLDRAQMTWYMELYGNPRQYQPGRYTPNMAYGVSQKINDSLSPFKVVATFTSDSSGVVTLPSNYIHLLALNTTESNADAGRNVLRPVQILNEDELIERLESQVCPVSLSDPIGIESSSKKILLYPEVAQVGKIYYMRKPVAPVYDFTQAGRVITYVNVTSTQMEWDEPNMNTIIAKALGYVGINLGAQDIIQLMELKDKQGV